MASLRSLAKEMRQQIFELCLDSTNPASDQFHLNPWHEESPALLVALRGQDDLYDEALYIFYKLHTCYYTLDNFKGFLPPNGCPLPAKNVRHLGIASCGGFLPGKARSSYGYMEFFDFLFGHAQEPLCQSASTNLETIQINLRKDFLGGYLNLQNHYTLLYALTAHVTRLRRVCINNLRQGEGQWKEPRIGKAEEDIEIVFGGLFGVESRREFTVLREGTDVPAMFTNTPYQVVEQWIWEAEVGEVLKNKKYGKGKGRA